jgi:hypothetical protein
MSRARPITFGGETYWFDRHQSNHKATAWQLELLSAVEGVSLDDILDEGLTQKQVLDRLRETLDQGKIPDDVLDRMARAREEALVEPACRICPPGECEGRITRHHFIPRWMMLMLENYQAYAPRRICTIPICVGRHRDLHLRGDTDTEKSITGLLTDQERAFGQKLLTEFRTAHPHVFDLIAGGDEATYEYQLVRDYTKGEFRSTRKALTHDESLDTLAV